MRLMAHLPTWRMPNLYLYQSNELPFPWMRWLIKFLISLITQPPSMVYISRTRETRAISLIFLTLRLPPGPCQLLMRSRTYKGPHVFTEFVHALTVQAKFYHRSLRSLRQTLMMWSCRRFTINRNSFH